MFNVKYSLETWLVQKSRSLLSQIIVNKLRKGSLDFLINSKLVTKSFSDEFIVSDSFYLRVEAIRLFRILTLNVRKRLPILKLGDQVYVVPFLEVLVRRRELRIQLRYSEKLLAVLERYTRFIGLERYLERYNIPFSITTTSPPVLIPTNQIPTSVIQISVCIRNRDSYFNLGFYQAIFRIPTIIRIIRTLHRKAYFNDTVSV